MSRSVYWSAAASVPRSHSWVITGPSADPAMLAEIKAAWVAAMRRDAGLIVLPSSVSLVWA